MGLNHLAGKKHTKQFAWANHLRTIKLLLLVAIIICVILGTFYVYKTSKDYIAKANAQAIGLTESAEAFLSPELIAKLGADPSDTQKPEYKILKTDLIKFKNYNPSIDFAYLFAQKDGKLFFMVDSEIQGSEGYSPPGQEYIEATKTDMQPFADGKSIVTKPSADRWGTWVSALVPVKDPGTGKVIAVLGVDYPAKQWNSEVTKQVTQAILIVLCILSLLISIYFALIKNITLRALGGKLKDSEALFRTVFEQAPIGIAVVNGYEFLSNMNPMYEKILGRTKENLNKINWKDITHPDDLKDDLLYFSKFQSGEIPSYSMVKRFIRPDGSFVWVNMIIAPLQLGNASQNHLCLIEDINESKRVLEALHESERSKGVLLSHLPGMAYRCNFDRNWTMQFVSEGCFALTGYKPESLLNNKELSFSDLISPEYRELLWNEWISITTNKTSFKYEYEITTATGERKCVLELGQGIYDNNGTVEALEGIVIDITESKQDHAQIAYMIDHDFMTGLNNRKFYEEAKRVLDKPEKLPFSIIIGDINGVRMINDAFGHKKGDLLIKETAKIIQSCCRDGDILARTGGDEFGILLPNTTQAEGYQMMKKITAACEKYNASVRNKANYINLSLGCGTKTKKGESLDDAEKDAEDIMYKRKLLERKSYHSAILSSIMTTLYISSQETEAHATRLATISSKIGEKLSLPQKSLDDLQLLSMLHDIGKVGIDDRILNKPDSLNAEEWVVMKKHPELGYRIAMTSPELEHIAENILTHHEHWDGTGYPAGLKGQQIPLLSRILAVADAYDAMTQDRIYRKALAKEEAIEEIKKNSGIQFDPTITQIFIDTI